ncbi:hypothetical protein Hanom_Chr12g01114921 [Helianthus anomalus]
MSQFEYSQLCKVGSNNSKIRISNSRIKRTRWGLRKIKIDNTCKACSHFTKHVRTSTCTELLPLGALNI